MDKTRNVAATMTKEGENAIGEVRDIAETAWEKSRETWKDLSTQGREVLAEAQKSTEEAWEDAQKLVQKHPGKAVGIALLVGAAIGALLMFSSKD